MTQKVLWVWLAEACGAGNDTFARLNALGLSPDALYHADQSSLSTYLPKKPAAVRRLSDKNTARAQDIVAFCALHDIAILPYSHPLYPPALRQIENPPVLLYVKGDATLLTSSTQVAIVGSRDVSEYGTRMAFRLGRQLAEAGIVVVSGLALGTDSVAHAGAICSNGKTVAVVASGVDKVYPVSHRTLAKHIGETGAIVSEYPPGTKPQRYYFPLRNRIVGAISQGVVVVEGSKISGSLITARHALRQGKDVFALPGRVDDLHTVAPMMLLSEGAHMLVSAQQIIAHYLPEKANQQPIEDTNEDQTRAHYLALFGVHGVEAFKQNPSRRTKNTLDHSPDHSPEIPPASSPKSSQYFELEGDMLAVYERIPEEGACLPDELAGDGLSPMQVMRALTSLEIEGAIQRHPSGRVSRSK